MSLREDVDKCVNKWQTFFFTPQSPTPMALYRIAVGIIVLQCLLVHILADWSLYYGDYAVIPIEDMISRYWFTKPYFDLMLFLPDGEVYRWYFFLFTVLCALMMTLGLFTRVTSVLTFLCLMSLQTHFQLNQNAGDNFLRLSCMFIALSNAGDAFSMDRLIKSLKQDWRVTGFLAPLSAPWAQRLMQIQLAIAYGHTWFCKIDGAEWNSGIAVYYASRYDDVTRFGIPFLLDNIWTIKILTWGTLVVELLLFTLIWWRPYRYWVLLSGLALHLGIEWTMNLPMFEWLFICSYFLFIYPEDLAKFWDMVKTFVHTHIFKPATLYFDGDCILCIRTVGFLHHLDIFSILNLVDFRTLDEADLVKGIDAKRMEKEILLRTFDGKIIGGFEAFRWMSGRMPLIMILWPLLYLPIIAQIGQIIYKLVAANREAFLGSASSPSK